MNDSPNKIITFIKKYILNYLGCEIIDMMAFFKKHEGCELDNAQKVIKYILKTSKKHSYTDLFFPMCLDQSIVVL